MVLSAIEDGDTLSLKQESDVRRTPTMATLVI
jgi:hypothetical protein